MNIDNFLKILEDNFKLVVPYYQILPSFLFAFSIISTDNGNNECVSKADNLFNLEADDEWIDNNNYINIKDKLIRSYDSPYESIIDFCEVNKEWLINETDINNLFKYINSNVEELNKLSSKYKEISVNKLKLTINNYDLNRYDNMITDEYLSSSCGVRFYTLKKGDCLRNIALHFDTSVSNIIRLNNIFKLNDLKAGKVLKIL